jgi:hypothetical protein
MSAASTMAILQALAALSPQVTSPGQAGRIGSTSGGTSGGGSPGSPNMQAVMQAMLLNQKGGQAPIHAPANQPQMPGGGQAQPQQQAPQQQMPQQQQTPAQQQVNSAQLGYANTQSQRFRPGSLMGLGEGIYDAFKEKGARQDMIDAQSDLQQQQTAAANKAQTDMVDATSVALQGLGNSKKVADGIAQSAAASGNLKTLDFSKFDRRDASDMTDKGKQIGERKKIMAENPDFFDQLSEKEKDWYVLTGTDQSKSNLTTSYNIPAGWAPDDPNNPNAGIHEIPGSKPYQDRVEGEQTAKVAWRNQMAEVSNVLDVAYDAMDLIGPTSTGLIGPMMAKIGGTDAADLKEMASTLKANTAFKALFQMREASKTGGALGNVSNQEIKLLHDSWRSLGQNQSPAQLRKNMQAMITKFERAKFALENDEYFRTIPTKDAYKMVDDHIASIRKSGDEEEVIPGLPQGFQID